MSPSPGMGRKEEDRVVVGADTLGETQMFSPASMAGHPLAMRMDLSRIQGHYRQLANRQAETSEQSCPESKGSEVSGHMQAKFLKATGRLLRQAQERKGRGRGRGRRGRGLGRGGRRKGERIPAKDLTAALGAQEAASGGAASRGEQVRAPRGTMGTFAGYKRPVGKEAGEEFDMIRVACRTWAEQRKDQTNSQEAHKVKKTASGYLKYMRAKVKVDDLSALFLTLVGHPLMTHCCFLQCVLSRSWHCVHWNF